MIRLRRFSPMLLLLAVLLAPMRAAALSNEVSASRDPARQILVMVRQPSDHFWPGGFYGGAYGSPIGRSSRERLAREIARKYGLKLLDAWPMPMIGKDCFVMAVPTGQSVASAVEKVSHDRDVDWSEPIAFFQAQGAAGSHNDPLYQAQPAARFWHLADLHQLAVGRGIRIAVIDSGIDENHPDLAGQLLLNRNFVVGESMASENHGTAVAGVIAAKADNGIGIAGIAPGAKLLGLRACWQVRGSSTGETDCDSFSLAKALYFAVEQKAQVINLSLSGPDDRLLRELVNEALTRGLPVVSAVDPKLANGGFPASVPGVIAVSDKPMVSARTRVYIAPGRDVPTTEPQGRWSIVNGSSFAAAHVSGLAALVREHARSPAITLLSQRTGEIDACATLIRVAHGCDCTCASVHYATARLRH